MTSITTLPPELLSQILSLNLLSESDLTSCALVSKAFNSIAAANLYRDVCFDLPHFAYTNEERSKRNKQLRSVQLLLTQLAANDKLADRVHSLILHGFSNNLNRDVATHTQLRSSTLAGSGLVDDLEISMNVQPTFSQLASKMTKLKVLNLDVGFTKLLLQDGVVFPNLEVVVLWSLNAYFPQIQSLMSQPRITEICFNHGNIKTCVHAPRHSSTVTRIVLDSPRGFPRAVALLVQAPKSLRSLKWRFYSNCCLRGCAHQITLPSGKRTTSVCSKLQESVNLTLKQIAHSLEVLVLTYGHHSVRCSLSPILIPSLRRFEYLQELRIEASMLLGIQSCPSRVSRVPTKFRPGCELATILPSTLETLHLEIEREQMDRDEKNYCGDIVRGIVQQQISRSIHLGHLVMEEINPRYTSNCYCIPKGLCYRDREHIETNWNLEAIWEMEKECAGVGVQLSYVWRRGSFEDPIKLILRSGGVSLHATTRPWDWTTIGV